MGFATGATGFLTGATFFTGAFLTGGFTTGLGAGFTGGRGGVGGFDGILGGAETMGAADFGGAVFAGGFPTTPLPPPPTPPSLLGMHTVTPLITVEVWFGLHTVAALATPAPPTIISPATGTDTRSDATLARNRILPPVLDSPDSMTAEHSNFTSLVAASCQS